MRLLGCNLQPDGIHFFKNYKYLGTSGAFYENRYIQETLLAKTSVGVQSKNKHLFSSPQPQTRCNITTETLLREVYLEEK